MRELRGVTRRMSMTHRTADLPRVAVEQNKELTLRTFLCLLEFSPSLLEHLLRLCQVPQHFCRLRCAR